MYPSVVFPAQHQMTYFFQPNVATTAIFIQRTTMVPVAVPVYIPVPVVSPLPMNAVQFYFPSVLPSTSFQMEAKANVNNDSVDSGVDMDETDPSLSQDVTLPVCQERQDSGFDEEQMEWQGKEEHEANRLSPEEVDEMECLDVLATLGVTKTLHRFGAL